MKKDPRYMVKLPNGRMVKLRELVRPPQSPVERAICPKCLEGALKVVAHAGPMRCPYYRCGTCNALFTETDDER